MTFTEQTAFPTGHPSLPRQLLPSCPRQGPWEGAPCGDYGHRGIWPLRLQMGRLGAVEGSGLCSWAVSERLLAPAEAGSPWPRGGSGPGVPATLRVLWAEEATPSRGTERGVVLAWQASSLSDCCPVVTLASEAAPRSEWLQAPAPRVSSRPLPGAEGSLALGCGTCRAPLSSGTQFLVHN